MQALEADWKGSLSLAFFPCFEASTNKYFPTMYLDCVYTATACMQKKLLNLHTKRQKH